MFSTIQINLDCFWILMSAILVFHQKSWWVFWKLHFLKTLDGREIRSSRIITACLSKIIYNTFILMQNTCLNFGHFAKELVNSDNSRSPVVLRFFDSDYVSKLVCQPKMWNSKSCKSKWCLIIINLSNNLQILTRTENYCLRRSKKTRWDKWRSFKF